MSIYNPNLPFKYYTPEIFKNVSLQTEENLDQQKIKNELNQQVKQQSFAQIDDLKNNSCSSPTKESGRNNLTNLDFEFSGINLQKFQTIVQEIESPEKQMQKHKQLEQEEKLEDEKALLRLTEQDLYKQQYLESFRKQYYRYFSSDLDMYTYNFLTRQFSQKIMYNDPIKFKHDVIVYKKLQNLFKKSSQLSEISTQIISTFNASQNSNSYIIQEKGIISLKEWIDRRIQYNIVFTQDQESQLFYIANKLVKSINILHQKSIYHSNICPENIEILYAEKLLSGFDIKISDSRSFNFSYNVINCLVPQYYPDLSKYNMLLSPFKRLRAEFFQVGRIIQKLCLSSVFIEVQGYQSESCFEKYIENMFQNDLQIIKKCIIFLSDFFSPQLVHLLQVLLDYELYDDQQILKLVMNQQSFNFSEYQVYKLQDPLNIIDGPNNQIQKLVDNFKENVNGCFDYKQLQEQLTYISYLEAFSCNKLCQVYSIALLKQLIEDITFAIQNQEQLIKAKINEDSKFYDQNQEKNKLGQLLLLKTEIQKILAHSNYNLGIQKLFTTSHIINQQ
ncbi:Protein kinase-like domain [Pseudocohnilembus persalinus]|uniref:Protein kinase-like domain n=1 Tax=Pseudocohnilembus persalinus TaxID=266149 RepID=A0A0V0QNS0_PSEPJ|nr:Protein kinase-like domain [Pseudocohnilembus persalinus]|eukprot:KRX03770.1 Protein kinase-like domain [Pseudocohnilembus persalinus]